MLAETVRRREARGIVMGLNERRAMKELQDVTFPERVREIEEICGASIDYEVDWSTLENDSEALRFLDNGSCHRINMALRAIGGDDMGRQAIREGLTLIKLANVPAIADMAILFTGGVLDMRCAYAKGTDGFFTDGAIREVLEQAL